MANKAKNVTATQRKSIALGIVLAVIVVGVAVASVNLVGRAISNYKWTQASPGEICVDSEGSYVSTPDSAFGIYEVAPGVTTIGDLQFVDECAGVDNYGVDQVKVYRCINPDPGKSAAEAEGVIYSLESCRRWEKCIDGVCVPKGPSID